MNVATQETAVVLMVPSPFTGSSGRRPRRPWLRVSASRKYGAMPASKSPRFWLCVMAMSQFREFAARNRAAACRLVRSIWLAGNLAQFTRAQFTRSAKLFDGPNTPSSSLVTYMPFRMYA